MSRKMRQQIVEFKRDDYFAHVRHVYPGQQNAVCVCHNTVKLKTIERRERERERERVRVRERGS